ncbi:MAG: hypothetical protein IJ583_05540 [Firmicutes bacterium]|nr:hypothetical protein [Bacillota bacterium]
MTKNVNQQTNNGKQYHIPMEVTKETIKDFNIDPADVVWTKIGNRRVKAAMIPVEKEVYYQFMRPLWREDKRNQRAEPMVSLDELTDEYSYEVSDCNDIAEDYAKKVLIDKLHSTLDELDEIDRKIMGMYGEGKSESKIGESVHMSQRGVNKRKHKILSKLKKELKDFR